MRTALQHFIVAGILLCLHLSNTLAQGVSITTDNTEADNSSMLDVKSTSKGILIPRLTYAQRNAISAPALGLLVFQTDNQPGFYYYDGAAWVTMLEGLETDPQVGSNTTNYTSRWNGTSLVQGGIYDNGSNVGIGTTTLDYRLQVNGDFNFTDNTNAIRIANVPVFSVRGSGNLWGGAYAGTNITDGSGNVGLGYYALYTTTTGTHNQALGQQALYSNGTGHYNFASGYRTLYNNTSGSHNIGIGRESLYSNTEATHNIAFGYRVLYSNVSGISNIGLGRQVLYNTTGSYNTAMGYYAMFSNTTGAYNTALGFQAMYNSTEGVHNFAGGYRAMYSNTDGSYNVAIGRQSMYFNTSGNFNAVVGYRSLYNNTSGGNNAVLGTQALHANTTGSHNIAAGNEALFYNVSGAFNIGLGYRAGYTNTVGEYNTFIGRQADATTDDLQRAVAIGYNAKVGKNDAIVLGDATNNSVSVGIGTNTPDNSAILDLTSTTKGILVPRMTLAQRDAISSPATGLLIFQTDNNPDFYYYNGAAWTRANTPYGAGTGISISGSTISAQNTSALWNASQLQGNSVANTTPAFGQVLKWNGSNWAPSGDNNTNTTYTASTGLSLTGTTFAAQNTSALWNASQLQGNSVANTAPTSGQVLKWNGSDWAPSSDNNTNTTYTASTGLSLTGTTFAAQNTSALWNASQLQGNSVASTAPTNGQVLTWDGSSWAPGNAGGVSESDVETYVANDVDTYRVPYDNGTKLVSSGIYYQNDNVGIGYSSPNYKLEVDGDINLRSYSTVIRQAGTPILRTSLGGSIFVGKNVGNASSSATNTALGAYTLTNVTTGSANVSIGYATLSSLTTGYHNIALGYNALQANETGQLNVAIGSYVFPSATAGYNVGIGPYAGNGLTGGQNNVFIGGRAGNYNTTGSNNIAIGLWSGNNLKTGSYNVAIGDRAGMSADGFSRTTAIGYQASAGQDDAVVLGQNNTSVKVGMGTSTPSEKLHVIGNILASGSITANSDVRYKKQINKLDGALDKVLQLRGVSYFWKREQFPKQHFTKDKQIGFIAQELEKVYPEMVVTSSNGYKSVDYAKLTPVLVEAIKDQQKHMSKQGEQLAKQAKEIAELKKALKASQNNVNTRLAALEQLMKKQQNTHKDAKNQTAKK